MTENFLTNILNDWSEFTKSDSKPINLNSWDYTFNRYSEKIIKLTEIYNVPSEITTIYLKNLFNWFLAKASISLSSLLNNDIDLSCIKRLFKSFNDEQMLEFEKSFYDTLNYISAKISNKNLIGEVDFSKLVEDSLDAIFDELIKCRLEIYQKGSVISKIDNISTDIYIFNTLVECLSVLQNYSDGLYVCYISNHNTSDGYFGFFIKNNGNIFSINERVAEAFIGQHQHGRNHRFVEQKTIDIFPYELFDFSNYDYKGYAKTYTLKDKENHKVSLADLSQKSYITLLMTILMIKFRVENKHLDGDIVYSNFYLSNNIQTLQNSTENKLMVVSDNAIVTVGENKIKSIISELNTDVVVSGKFNEMFSIKAHPERNYTECGKFDNNIFIDLYANGFIFDPTTILIDNSIKQLSTKNAIINAEFIGNEREMSLQIYKEARRQLANYIKAEMTKEYEAFKAEFGSVENWWENKLESKIDSIREFAIQAYVDAKANNKITSDGWRRIDEKITVHYGEDVYYKSKLDFYNGKPCNCRITIQVTDWLDIEQIIGEEVPKIIKGYTERRAYYGNANLDVIDPVLRIQTPFESTGSFSMNFSRFTFPIHLYFSKSGLKKYIKDNYCI